MRLAGSIASASNAVDKSLPFEIMWFKDQVPQKRSIRMLFFVQ